jgi:hypothetical protein
MVSPLQPPLVRLDNPWLRPLLADPNQERFIESLEELLLSERPGIAETLTALELAASAWDWSRFQLEPELRAAAQRIAAAEPFEREAISRLTNGLLVLLYRRTTPEEVSRHYLDDLSERLWRMWLGEYELPDLPRITRGWERHLALLPMLFGCPILEAQLFVWPDTTLEEVDMELGLLLDCGASQQSVIIGAMGIGPFVRFGERFEECYRGDGELDRGRSVYTGPADLLCAPDSLEWSWRLFDIALASDFGYLLGNSLVDAQVLPVDRHFNHGFRLRFKTGPDLWCINTGDQALLTIGDPPQFGWMPLPVAGIWCSEYQP